MVTLRRQRRRTINQIQSDLRAFDAAARRDSTPAALAVSWKRIFGNTMTETAAKGFSDYYKKMVDAKKTRKRATSRKQRGGAAPLDYTMTPGIPLATWGQFPVEVDTDPGSIKDLDVYFHDSLPLSAPGYWPSVPADMGSNKFVANGGMRRRNKKMRTRRRQRGGNLLESLVMRPIFTATAPPNIAQIAANAWAGSPAAIPTPPSAVHYTWSPAGASGTLIDPGRVTQIGSDFAKLASPAPWGSTLPSAPLRQ